VTLAAQPRRDHKAALAALNGPRKATPGFAEERVLIRTGPRLAPRWSRHHVYELQVWFYSP
jgi:hypothetical protein